MAPDHYNATINIRELPRRVDKILNALAALKKKYKREIIRDALVEYAEKHKHELAEV